MIIRDIFITNMLDDDIQRELFRGPVDPERALSIAVNMEMGHNGSHPTTTTTITAQLAVQSMLYNHSIVFAARMHAEINQAEYQSIEQRLVYLEDVAKFGLQHIVRFALLWVRNAIIVVYLTSSLRYVGKN